jgi:serine/threonine protein kinase
MADEAQARGVPRSANTRLGRYALGRSLGRGGMGEVFHARAFGAEGVVKELCVKRIRTERLARPGALAQFVAEARLWMRLHHGNIVPVFDFGRAGTEYYLAMEWVDGADVRALIEDARTSGGPLAACTAAHIAGEVARALAYAHAVSDEHGNLVVHRDVKPANVLVSRSGDVRLTDFGVAVAGLDTSPAAPRGGTPVYMAPEQMRGEVLDARADLYSLGVLLHELLSGARPMDGVVALPSTTPRDVADVVSALLQETPDARPKSAAAVARLLEAAVGRARARGEEPRDDLGRRAARIADHRAHGNESSGELSADASFVDAEPGEPPAMTESTVSAASVRSQRGAPLAAQTPRGSRRRLLTIGAAMSVLVAGVVALFAVRGVDRRSAATPTANRAAPSRTPPASAVATPMDEPPPADLSARPVVDVIAPAHAEIPTRRPIERARPSSAPVELEAAEPGRLNVNATPWAEVWIDGTSYGTTPIFGAALTPGRHLLRFANAPLGVERETTVTLTSGERRDLVVDLVPAQAPTDQTPAAQTGVSAPSLNARRPDPTVAIHPATKRTSR